MQITYENWKACKNILCVRLDNMGDIIMLMPSLHALKESFPATKLTLLTSSVGASTTKFIPDIDETIIFDAPWIENDVLSPSTQQFFALIETLQKKHFDAAILFTNYSQSPFPSALITYLAGIPKVLSYSRELPNNLITHWIPDTEPFSFPIHGVQRQLNLVSGIGAKTTKDNLALKIPEAIVLQVKKKLEENNINIHKPFLVLHPGASLERRQYPSHLYTIAAKKIIAELDCQIVLTGVGNEKVLTDNMQREIGIKSFSLAGILTLGEFIGLIRLADLVISNNTSPVHIAAAVRTPVVVLYARGNPEHTPWKVKNKVLYFDIPENMRSKNTLLSHTTPQKKVQLPQPKHILQAVQELLYNRKESNLPKELTTWEL